MVSGFQIGEKAKIKVGGYADSVGVVSAISYDNLLRMDYYVLCLNVNNQRFTVTYYGDELERV